MNVIITEPFHDSNSGDWNTRDGYWRDRRTQWLNLGIKSDLGRPTNLTLGKTGSRTSTGTSVFDPVVCELAYRKWCPEGGQVLDPFAGGSVRGIVASALGRRYWGCDIRPEQIEANRRQLNKRNTGTHAPEWVVGDSYTKLRKAPEADFIFSCPPYGDLECYSDNPSDLSTMPREQFLRRYKQIVTRACEKLRGEYACFVVGNYRNKQTGALNDFVGDTIRTFEAAGLQYDSDLVLLNCMAGVPLRAARAAACGKVVRVHQYILVFKKSK